MSSDDEDDGEERSDEEERNAGQYDDDDSDDEVKKTFKKGDLEESSDDEDDHAPKSKKVRRKDSDGSDEEVTRKKKGKLKKSKYIDDAAEESDGEGGAVKDDDDDDEDDDDDDDDDDDGKGKKKSKRAAWIVDDEETEVVEREKVTISEREKRLDDEDYALIQENVGLDLRRDDDSESDGEGTGRERKRLKRKAQDDDDDEDDAVRVSRKKGASGLQEALGLAGGDEEEGQDRGKQKARGGAGYESDDSMASFISYDDGEEREGEAEGGGGGGQPRKRKRGGRGRINDNDLNNALAIFGEDFDDGDMEGDEEDEEGVRERKAEEPSYDQIYEPTEIEESHRSKEDDVIRFADMPERLQIDMKDREKLESVEEARDLAKWMFMSSNFKETERAQLSGPDMIEVVDLETGEPQKEEDGSTKMMTESDVGKQVRENLIQKLTNVICFYRGIEYEDIKHGPIQLEKEFAKDDDEEEKALAEKMTTPMYDIPFIARYRQEYWKPELAESDLWLVYDLDAQWCRIQSRKKKLEKVALQQADELGIKFAKICQTVEHVQDLSAYLDIRYPETNQASEQETKGYKRPVRTTKHTLCMSAKLDQFFKRFCLTSEQFAENLEVRGRGRGEYEHEPNDPAEEPDVLAFEYVNDATKYGFSEAVSVVDGMKWFGAKEVASNPQFRKHVRESYIADNAVVTCKLTRKGEDSPDQSHLAFANLVETHHKRVSEEDMLLIQKANQEGLLEVKIGLDSHCHNEAILELAKCWLSSKENSPWNRIRVEILEKALEDHIYPTFQQELLNIRCLIGKRNVGYRIQMELERLIEVSPYRYNPGSDKKRKLPDRICAVSYAEPSEMVLLDSQGQVESYQSVNLRVSNNTNSQMRDIDRKIMVETLVKWKPDVIVLGANGLKCRTLRAQLENLALSKDEGGDGQLFSAVGHEIEVHLLDQTVAYKFAHSHRAQIEFKNYPPARKMAVSLGRRLQDPLREFAGLTARNSDDLLSLAIHPMQFLLEKSERLKFLHRAFINVVNKVGVDLNMAADMLKEYSYTAQFVSGLGPRKANEILTIMNRKGCVYYREQLLDDPDIKTVMRRVVWTNAVGFFKITKNTSVWNEDSDIGEKWDEEKSEYVSANGGPLEATRIHPESYRFAFKIASDALEEVVGSVCVKRAMHPDKHGILDELALDLYAENLVSMGIGLKYWTLMDIRKELQDPWSDPRRTQHHKDPSLLPWELNKREEFNLLTGESDVSGIHGPKSSLIDTVVHVRVMRVIAGAPRDREGNPGPDSSLPFKIICRLENQLTGTLEQDFFGDTEEEVLRFQKTVREDQILSCVVTQVKFEEFAVELSHKSSALNKLERVGKKDSKQKTKILYVRRNITHPSFKNFSRNKAMQALENEEDGSYIIRPSSAGLDILTIHRKVCDKIFHETQIKMYQQVSKLALGKVLEVDSGGKMTFEDLDELIVGYVEPVIENDKRIMSFDKFDSGTPEEIKEKLVAKKQQSGGRGSAPYLLGFNRKTPGIFTLFWLPGSKTVIEESIRPIPQGYSFRGQTHGSVNRLLNWFKQHAMDLHKQGNSGGGGSSYQTQRLHGGWGPPAAPPSRWGSAQGGGEQWGAGSGSGGGGAWGSGSSRSDAQWGQGSGRSGSNWGQRA